MATRKAMIETIWRNTPKSQRTLFRGWRYVSLHPTTALVDMSHAQLRKLAAVTKGDAKHRNRSATVSILPFAFAVGQVVYRSGVGYGEVVARARNARGWRQYAVVFLSDPGHLRRTIVDEADLRKVSAASQGRYGGIVAAQMPEAERRRRFDAEHLASGPEELAALQATPAGRHILAERARHNREHWARVDVRG